MYVFACEDEHHPHLSTLRYINRDCVVNYEDASQCDSDDGNDMAIVSNVIVGRPHN